MTITSVHDGSSDKFYRAWADSADGSKGFSTTDSSKEYFGVYAGTTPPANYKAYSWTKIKGEAGRSVTNTEMEYAINDSKVTPPKSGWSLEMPVWKTGLYIWQRVKVSYSTGNPSYTTPHCLESNIIEDVTGNIGDWIFRDKTEVLSGTEIFTDKADDNAVVHVEIDGKSYQHLNPNARNMIPTAYKDWEDGHYSTSGAKEPYVARIRVPWLVKVEPNTTYHWNSGNSSTHFVIRSFDNSGAFSRSWGGIGSSGSRTTSSSEHYLGIAFYNTSNYEAGFSNGTIKPLFQLASHSDKSFEEFVPPAPTPEYPIEIHSLNDFDVVSSVTNRNLLTSDFTIGRYLNEDDGTISISGEHVVSDFTRVEENASYTLSSKNGVWFTRIVFYNRFKKFLHGEFFIGYNEKLTVVSPKGTVFARVSVDRNIKTVRTDFNTLKLEEGNLNTDWAPAPEDITEDDNHPLIDKINLLLDEPLRSVGDVHDRLYRDSDGLWKVERNVGEVKIDGKTHWSLEVKHFYTAFSATYNAAKTYNYQISHFKFNKSIVDDGISEGFRFGGMTTATHNGNLIVYMPRFTSVSGLKGFLDQNPMTVVFEKATTTIETLPQSIQDKLNNLRTFKDSNYIYIVLPDKSDILSEKLKPTLHATFKSVAWANDFRYKFEQAKAMHATDIWFAKGVSNTIAPNIGWSTDAPVWEDGLYIWSKTITTYGNGRTEETSPVCITGATGRSVDKIEEWYYLSNKPDVLEGGTWSKTPPTWKDGKYIWTKNKIIYKNPSGSEETSPINTTGGSGQKGDSGTDAKTVRLGNIIHAVHFDQDGLMPSVSSIAFPTAIQGFSGLTPYYEFKMGDTIVRGLSTASSWTLNTSAMKYSDFPLTVSVNVVINGQTMATDTVTIVGTKPGEDAYTVVLANESHTFVGDVSNAKAGSTTANVIAYRGGTQVGATIGSITGLPTGMSSAIYSNGTTAARVTFTVTTGMTSPNGVVNIPVTVNGKSFTKVFNYAIAFKGAKGDKGTDGIAGKDGVGIRTTVLAYASSTSGTTTPTSGWTSTVPTVAPGNYLWTRTTWNYSDNSSENGYTVSRIGKDGNTGANGVAGKDGVGIKSTVIHYGKSTSGTSYSGVTWTTAIPSVSNGQFLWTRTTWTYDDNTIETGYSVAKMGETGAKGDKGDKGDKGTDGVAGKDGVGIKSTTITYGVSANETTQPATYTGTVPTLVKGQYLWTKTVWVYTDDTTETGYTKTYIPKDGNNGTNGIAGKDGVGITKTTITYAKSSSGTTAPTTGYTTTVPSANPGEFVWTKTVWTYTDNTTETGYSVGKIGNTGATGATGKDGVAGKDGVGIKTTTLNYASSTSGTTTPTSGWQSTVPTVAAGNYLWTRTTWTYTDNSSENGYTVSRIGKDGNTGKDGVAGKDGVGISKTVIHYASSTSGTTAPTSGWVTTVPSVAQGSYLWTRTTWTYTDGTNETGYSAARMGANGATGAKGDKGNPGENATARNFLLESKPNSPITNSSYPIANFLLAEKPVVGETYTITIKGQLAATKTAFYAYNSGGSINLVSNIVHQGNGLYYKSFKWINSYSTGTTANDTSVVIYPFTSSQPGTSTIEWITMVKGSVPLKEWVPAHEDIYQYVDDVEIGARNIVKGSNSFYLDGSDMQTVTSREFSNNVGKIRGLSSGQFNAYQWMDEYITDPNFFSKAGEKYIFSVDIKATGTVTAVIGFDFRDSTGSIRSQFFNSGFSANGQWQRVLIPYTVIGDGKTRMLVNLTGTITSGAVIEYKDFKIEKGDKATGWSPAPEDVQSSIEQKADNSETEAALNEAAAKLQVLQQEIEAAATSNELKDFIDKYNKDMASRDKDARESESSLSTALASISSIQTNMGDMSATWQFIDRFIKNTPQGIVVGNDSSGSYILIKEDRLSFYSNGQEVAFISQNLMEISRGAFVEEIQIAKYKFEESTNNHLTIRYVG